MLKCVAIDDEPLALALLEDNISKVPYLQLVAKCSDTLEATKVLQENKIDLAFIDIQMPGLTGLEFIESLSQKPMFILITAYKQYALESYSLNVVDYLVKPVPLTRFIAACNKAYELYQLKNKAISPQAAPMHNDFFFLNADYSLVKVFFKDILWIEGLKDYIKVHLKQGNKPIITRMTLKEIEDQLPVSLFIRIHKSYIISIENITSIKKNNVFIQDVKLPVGETYRDNIQKLTGKKEN
ncbi:MAG TPA: LytTR family DNA-binding domain-containing protein [Chitinophagaceae bacterium]|nr:response regulator transcription factor [Chitinophagaceae bacterium]MCB9054823.1 response regulator transcription factor [Chitinophagales bacterium]HPG11113.1 LytTR family DNA-binding domain-containing protein [Chitinophagaceae bacterium]